MAEQMATISANKEVKSRLDGIRWKLQISRARRHLQRKNRWPKIGAAKISQGEAMEKLASVVQLKTQLVKEGHTRNLLAETDLMTLRIHCYAPGIGENALHAHTKEDHIFLVLQGTAKFNTGRDGKGVVTAEKNQAVVLPAGCYYQFCNSGSDPLVMARIGAGSDKADQRLNPDGSAIPGRAHEQGAAKPVLIEGAFFE
jgi:mannose-6-phosphate isomerase-like protein (cupin superfamily)